jgi:dolichol kinase
MLATIQSGSFCLLVCCLKKVNIIITQTIILSVILYECETWSLTLREEHRLRVLGDEDPEENILSS